WVSSSTRLGPAFEWWRCPWPWAIVKPGGTWPVFCTGAGNCCTWPGLCLAGCGGGRRCGDRELGREWGGWRVAVVATVFAALAAWFVLPRFLTLIERAGVVRANYLGRPVPVAAGTAVALVYAAALMLILAAGLGQPPGRGGAGGRASWDATLLVVLLLVAWAMALVGLADEVFGDRTARGRRGHLGALRRGVLTTGAVKALFGLVTGLAAAAHVSSGMAQGIVNAALIPLSANAVN